MAGILSVRLTRQERAQLKEQRVTQGFRTTSDLIRYKIGFGQMLDSGEDMEIDNSTLLRTVALLGDRIDDLTRQMTKIGRKLGINVSPEQPKVLAPTGTIAAQKQDRFMIDEYPDMPAGFSR